MSTSRLSRIQELRARREKIKTIIERTCFPEQVAFIRDPNRFKALITARRAGKSTAAAWYIVIMALMHARKSFLYVGLSSESATDAAWPVMEEAFKLLKVQYTWLETRKICTLANGSTIKFFGLDSSPRDQNKVLGKHFFLAVIDECQDHTQDLKRIVEKKLGPAMYDETKYGGGTICLVGTPGDLRGEAFWWLVTKMDAAGNPHPDRYKGWNVHEYDLSRNPAMADQFETAKADFKARLGEGYEQDPVWRSQWLGKWVVDPGTHTYKFDRDRNVLSYKVDRDLIASLLRGDSRWTYLLGCDTGHVASTAIIIGAYAPNNPVFYIVNGEKFDNAVDSKIAERLEYWGKKYNIRRMVMDTGGNKITPMSMASDYGLPVVPANKAAEKVGHISRFNSDLLSKRIMLLPDTCAGLIKEWEELILDKKALERGEWKPADKFADHEADACLYAWIDSAHRWAKDGEKVKPSQFLEAMLERRDQTRNPWEEAEEDIMDQLDREAEIRALVQEYDQSNAPRWR